MLPVSQTMLGSPSECSSASFYTGELLTANERQDPEKVGAQFEAIFYRMIFRQMREASLDEGLFGGREMEQFEEMQHNELAAQLGGMGELGLLESLARAAAPASYESAGSFEGLIKAPNTEADV